MRGDVSQSLGDSHHSMPEDRRCEDRYRKGTEILIIDRKHSSQKAQLHNLSRSGFCADSAMSLQPGQRVQVRLELPGRREVTSEAEIRWVQHQPLAHLYLFGATLEGMGLSQSSQLHRYLEPHSFDLMWSIDLLIKAACVIITILVVADIIQGDSELYNAILSKTDSFFESMPQMLLMACAGAGILYFFRRI